MILQCHIIYHIHPQRIYENSGERKQLPRMCNFRIIGSYHSKYNEIAVKGDASQNRMEDHFDRIGMTMGDTDFQRAFKVGPSITLLNIGITEFSRITQVW